MSSWTHLAAMPRHSLVQRWCNLGLRDPYSAACVPALPARPPNSGLLSPKQTQITWTTAYPCSSHTYPHWFINQKGSLLVYRETHSDT